MPEKRRYGLFATIGVVLLLTAVLLALGLSGERGAQPAPTPTNTPEPIVPTRTVAAVIVPAEPSVVVVATVPPTAETATPQPLNTPVGSLPTTGQLLPASELARFGVAGSVHAARDALAAGIPYGTSLNWNVVEEPPGGPDAFWQMVRLEEDGIRRTSWDAIEAALANNPGSYWLIGNEPDVKWQDNVTPQKYAEHYHTLYNFIKERDPSAKVVIGGVSQPTPLRRAYLDLVLDSYAAQYGEPMPVDVWNVHAFTLREEAGSWGVDIPPGMEGAEGILYEIDDHDDLAIMQQNLLDFRAWMADRGYGDRPLVVSEYGILMPEDYGFPVERVATFLTGSFDIFRTAANATGYPADENRLVQWWFWYSLYDGELYPTGNLWDMESQTITPLGEVWSDYVESAASP